MHWAQKKILSAHQLHPAIDHLPNMWGFFPGSVVEITIIFFNSGYQHIYNFEWECKTETKETKLQKMLMGLKLIMLKGSKPYS